jgi:hypothetical protein
MTVTVVTLPADSAIGIVEYNSEAQAVITHVTIADPGTPPPVPPPPVVTKRRTRTITNVRNEPNSMDRSILGQFKPGVVVDTVGEYADYYVIQAYVHKSMLEAV